MNRLLQGDVGSGKTIVATIAMVATALTGKQAALMVPTEILAEQHMLTIEKLIQGDIIESCVVNRKYESFAEEAKRATRTNREWRGKPHYRDTCLVPTRCEL